MNYETDQRIKVTDNSIFKMMGYTEVTGSIFIINPNGLSISIQCDQTRALESVDLHDGTIEILSGGEK